MTGIVLSLAGRVLGEPSPASWRKACMDGTVIGGIVGTQDVGVLSPLAPGEEGDR